ncbi:MAG: hypothetical protein AB8F74_03255 [Saprospiraceae bacterium]
MDHRPPTKATLPTVDLQTAIPALKAMVNRYIRESWDKDDTLSHLQSLADALEEVVPALLKIGAAAQKEVKADSDSFIPWFITFDWMDHAKSFLLLWRDILFQEQRAWLKVSEGEVKMEKFGELRHVTRQSITDASSTLFIDLESAGSHPLNNSKQLEKWRLQNLPWEIYEKQIALLPEQSEDLIQQSKLLWNASGTFVAIGSHFTEVYDFWLNQIGILKEGLETLIRKVESSGLVDNSELLTNELEQLDENWETPDNSEIFHAHLDDFISRLPTKEKIVADSSGGVLLYKEMNLRSEVRAWLESELIPEIYELFTIRDGITNKIHLNIVSVKNLLLVDEEGQQLSDKEAIMQVLSNFLKSLERSESRTMDMKSLALKKIKKDFTLSNIYKENFLARSLQYTISQYRDSARWSEIQSWFRKQGARVNQLQKNVLAEEALSISERIVRVVNSRNPDVENSHYTNMFLTKGWIGDSFVVGRREELARVATMVDNWKIGFRGAVLLTGKRFSGKTLFGELIDQRFFQNKSIKLAPYSRSVLPGGKHRHIDVGCDMNEALSFIARYAKDKHAMVWVDDLELWRSDKTSLAQNVNTLLKFIDNYSNRLFFVVSMSNWMKAQLSTAFEIDRVFQSEINIGSMSMANIRDAILVRHSATHTVLCNSEVAEITGTQLTRAINRVGQAAEHNIGEALKRWAYTVEKVDEEKVKVPNKVIHKLPAFLSTESALLLQAIMMEKKTTSKQLRKLFGPAYGKTYGVTLKRMLNLGILRKEQKNIIVNRYLVNEIGKLLSERINFRYGYQPNTKKQVKI